MNHTKTSTTINNQTFLPIYNITKTNYQKDSFFWDIITLTAHSEIPLVTAIELVKTLKLRNRLYHLVDRSIIKEI